MDISPITDYLFVSAQPQPQHADELKALGVRLILTMRGLPRKPIAPDSADLRSMQLRTFDSPITLISVQTLEQGVRAALPVIHDGGKVLTHCKHGRHRSVAMAAAILISMGFTADDAMKTLKQQRAIADPDIWYIKRQIQKFETYWRAQSTEAPGI